MFITILPYMLLHVFVCSKSYVTRMDSCGVLVAIVAYKTSHRSLAFVITLRTPGNGTGEPPKNPGDIYITWMVHQGGGSEKEHPVY